MLNQDHLIVIGRMQTCDNMNVANLRLHVNHDAPKMNFSFVDTFRDFWDRVFGESWRKWSRFCFV